jgi:hypothetical protein
VGNQCGSLPSAPIHLRSRGSLNTSGSSPRVPHSWCQPIPFPHSATSAIWTFNTTNLPGIPTLPRPTFKVLMETWEHRGFFCSFSRGVKRYVEAFLGWAELKFHPIIPNSRRANFRHYT